MHNFIRLTTILILFFSIYGCATARKEQFSESFFTYKNEQGKKYFSFILTLEGMTASEEYNPYEDLDRRRRGTGKNDGSRQTRKADPIARPEDPADVMVSLKFRMEEMAHKKLAARLDDIKYCDDKVEYEEEYSKFRYKIKGFCSE